MPIIVGSFDIGYRNLSLSIESFSYKSINNLEKQYSKLDKKTKIIETREHTPILQAIMNNFYKQGKNRLLELTDLNKGEKCGLQVSTRKNLNKYLQKRKEHLKLCTVIVIEQQFKTGQACNFDAILLGESVFSWCCYNLSVPVQYIPSRHKTSLLGMPRTVIETRENGLRTVRDIEKKDRKKWSVVKVSQILKLRKDYKTLAKLEDHAKQDDLSDVILQGYAWVLKEYIMDSK